MHSFRRALTGTLAAALVAGGFAFVSPAHADPNDGQGCAGVKTVPAAYVCVISATPGNAVPTVTSTPIPVDVPPICYVADCTDPTTVNVPVPGVTPGSGQVAVLWYQGVFYPIGIGTAGLIVSIVDGVLTLATTVAGDVVTTVGGLVTLATGVAGSTVTTVSGIAGGAVTTIGGLTGTVVTTANGAVALAQVWAANAIVNVLNLPADAQEEIQGILEDRVYPTTDPMFEGIAYAITVFDPNNPCPALRAIKGALTGQYTGSCS